MSKWVTTTLGESCHIYQPKTISTKEMVEDGPYPVFGANGIIGRYEKFNHEEPQLLVTCRGATCGAVNVSDPFSWITGNAMVIRPLNSSIDIKFLEYLFRGGIDISKAITGAAQPQITRTNLAPLAFQHPDSEEEQHRIVTLLDEAFADIASAKANAEKNLQNARALFESRMHTLFEENQNWERVQLENLLSRGWITSHLDGNHGSDYPKKEEFVDYGVPYIAARALRGWEVDFSEAKYLTHERAATIRKGLAQDGDVLFAHNATVGPVGVLKTKEPFVILGTSLTYYRCNEEFILPEYLAHYMRSPVFVNQYSQVMKQSTRNQVPITKQREFFHVIPPLSIQKKIATDLDSLSEKIELIESIYRQKLIALDNLKKSLLHQAFSGQL